VVVVTWDWCCVIACAMASAALWGHVGHGCCHAACTRGAMPVCSWLLWWHAAVIAVANLFMSQGKVCS
jgi:hypothetical protein